MRVALGGRPRWSGVGSRLEETGCFSVVAPASAACVQLLTPALRHAAIPEVKPSAHLPCGVGGRPGGWLLVGWGEPLRHVQGPAAAWSTSRQYEHLGISFALPVKAS